MPLKKTSLLATLLLCSLAGTAHADLQTWRLQATVYNVSAGFEAPAFASIGRSVAVDYQIETSASPMDGWIRTFPGAVTSVTINGRHSMVDGDLFTLTSGLSALNAAPHPGRSDGLTFLSLNRFGPPEVASVLATLLDFSAAAGSDALDFRLDFGTESVSARPVSFERLQAFDVPEPTSLMLLLPGLALAAGIRRKVAAR